ncbi:MAG: recombinase family protein [Candidatus Hydrogenedentes bacterium]|nr:recombinase family protein [Candidatus Hydrogenedentota bacterium]
MKNVSRKENIKCVCLYLRKSRDENQEDALQKHRQRLVRLCWEREWEVKEIYEEIVTGAKLDKREEMLKLLDNLHLVDAVVVVDLDRLGRNDIAEWGMVVGAFKKAAALIVTPSAIYDPRDPTDELLMNITGAVNHHEYRKIVSRFHEGKIEGTIMGRWTNGKPPYGYKYLKKVYDNNGKDVVVGEVVPHPEQSIIYRMIIDLYLRVGKSTQQITELLNSQGVSSPGGKLWHNNAIHRLLVEEFHLGKSIFGKTKGRWDKTTQSGLEIKPRSEWIVSKEQSHPALKTQEEHDQILLTLKRNRRKPVAARKGVYPLSGLLYCHQCGYRMRFYTKDRKSGKAVFTKCDYYGPFGKRCSQRGAEIKDEIYAQIVSKIRDEFITPERLAGNTEQEAIYKQKIEEIKVLEKELEKKAGAKARAKMLFLEGIENIEFYKKYKEKYDNETNEISSRIRALNLETASFQAISPEEMKEQINEFIADWGNATTNQEKNALFSAIINKAWYDRDRETGEIIIYLEYL